MRDWSLKTIICLSRWQSTLRGNDQYKGATLCLEGKILEKKMEISFNQARGILVYKRQFDPFSKWHWIFLVVKRGVMSGPLKLFHETENL
jgi:hypothetical protein